MRATLWAMRAAAGLDASRPEPAGLLAAFRDRTPSR
jgi:hypothetical protein